MIDKIYHLYLKSTGVSTDTRTVQKNNIFFALSGENFNGNKFAKQAIEKGAIIAIIDDENFETESTILVKNTLTTLQQLAKHHRKTLNIPIIGLTGSNGKTTTKELINAVLSQQYNTTATIGNLNNHIGVPLTLLSMTSETEIGIVEMGANHHKEIELLSNIACPDYGYITNFGKAHLEGFGSLEGVVQAKSELYEYLRKNNKVAFINQDDEKQIKQAHNIKQVTFSRNNNTSNLNIKLKDVSPTVTLQNHKNTIISNLIGQYNFSNIAAAICMGNYFKVSDKNIKYAIETYIPTNNRSQIINKNGHQIILDAYNANPTSMLAALENLKNETTKHCVLFLGDMFELGKTSTIEHQSIVDFANTIPNSSIYILGENFKKTNTPPNIKAFESFEKFEASFENNLKNNSTILIKGSRGMALERILELI